MHGVATNPSMAPRFTEFAQARAASRAMAYYVGGQLRKAIAARGRASLVVSGGRSPEAFFRELAQLALPWSAVTVLLADDRCVPASHEESNTLLVCRTLLTDKATPAHFLPVAFSATDPQAAVAAANQCLTSMRSPFDVVVLGMGEDGHTASIFPDSPQLEAALAPDAPRAYLYVESPSVPQKRYTLSARALRDTRVLLVQIHGEHKRAVYQRALQAGPVTELPIRLALHHPTLACQVFWSP